MTYGVRTSNLVLCTWYRPSELCFLCYELCKTICQRNDKCKV